MAHFSLDWFVPNRPPSSTVEVECHFHYQVSRKIVAWRSSRQFMVGALWTKATRVARKARTAP